MKKLLLFLLVGIYALHGSDSEQIGWEGPQGGPEEAFEHLVNLGNRILPEEDKLPENSCCAQAIRGKNLMYLYSIGNGYPFAIHTTLLTAKCPGCFAALATTNSDGIDSVDAQETLRKQLERKIEVPKVSSPKASQQAARKAKPKQTSGDTSIHWTPRNQLKPCCMTPNSKFFYQTDAYPLEAHCAQCGIIVARRFEGSVKAFTNTVCEQKKK